jgi:glutathione gamma-glutamylcysteinyltransferase
MEGSVYHTKFNYRWRWFSDEMLDCCAPLDKIRETGMTFAEVVSAGRCNGLNVKDKIADKTTYEQFISDLKLVTSSTNLHMITSFSRGSLSQTGDGHFSPIGCYDPESNYVLILDTARFKYPSYFVDAKLLFEAMVPIDAVTTKSRGYMILSKGSIV